MAFQVSPGVQVQEKDLTNVIPACRNIYWWYRHGHKGLVVKLLQLHLKKNSFLSLDNLNLVVINLKIGFVLLTIWVTVMH